MTKLQRLRRKIAIGLGQAERREFSERTVAEIARSVLNENKPGYGVRRGSGPRERNENPRE